MLIRQVAALRQKMVLASDIIQRWKASA